MNALNAYNRLNANVAGLKKASEKLSSGYRINRAGDDAAGLAISEKMRSQIKGLNQAKRNAQDGISMIQTFEGAAQQTHTILQRMKELATESANGTYDNTTDRDAMQLEFDQLNDELNQLADTDFNGRTALNGGRMADGKVADGNLSNITKVGATEAESNTQDITYYKNGPEKSIVDKVETLTDKTVKKLTLNGQELALGGTAIAPDGKVQAGQSVDILGYKGETVVSGNAIKWDTATEKFTAGDIIIDKIEVEAHEIEGGKDIYVAGENVGDPKVKTTMNNSLTWNGKTYYTDSATIADDSKWYAEDGTALAGYQDIFGQAGVKIEAGTGGTDGIGTKTDGVTPLYLKATITMADANWKQKEEVSVPNSYNNGRRNMTYDNMITLQTGARSKDAVRYTFKYDTDGIGDLVSNMDISARGLGTDQLSLSTPEDSNYAIDQIDNAINKTSMVRATFGAIQNRLDYKIENLTTTSENLTEAESNIRDTDMASEMLNYTKYNILQQAAQSMLAQANQQPQGILQLLG